MPVKKSVKSKKDKSTEEQDHISEPQQDEWDKHASSNSESEHDDAKQSRPGRQSIAKFDHNEIRKLDKDRLSGISNVELLRVLITRGEDDLNPNPQLKFGARDLLKRLGGERITRRRPFENGQRGGRGDRDVDRDSRPFQRRF